MKLKKAISVVMIGTMVGTLAAGMAATTTYAADTIKIGWLARSLNSSSRLRGWASRS